MNYWHFITISISLIILFWSFWAMYKAQSKILQISGSILAPVSLISALIGTLLLCVPEFFSTL